MPPPGYAARVAGDGEQVDWRALNRANWDDRVPVHLASSFYDLAGFRAGASSLRPFEVSEVGPVAGGGWCTCSATSGWTRCPGRGGGRWSAGWTSPRPRSLPLRRWLLRWAWRRRSWSSDVYDAVAAFGGQRFDIVYTGIGALVWLPDIPRWARVVANLLAPGGFLYLVEGHPFVQILDESSGSAVSW